MIMIATLDAIFQLDRDELQNFSSSLLGLPTSAEQSEAERLWNIEVLGEAFQARLKGFRDEITPGDVLIKFFEHYSTPVEDDPLHLRLMKNPVKTTEKLCPNVSPEESGRLSDAALHAFHELAQCCGLDSLTASLDTESTRELQETLNMPNTTWGALRFAEEFVRVKLSTLTSAQITIRPGEYSCPLPSISVLIEVNNLLHYRARPVGIFLRNVLTFVSMFSSFCDIFILS